MKLIELKPYGPGQVFYVDADKIVTISQIDYNGNYGSRIDFNDGTKCHTGDWPSDVVKKVNQ